MPLKVYSVCAYFTGERAEGEKPSNETFHALKFIKAIKGDPFRGYAQIPVPLAGRRRRLDENNRDQVFAWFAEMVAACFVNPKARRLVFVPVPRSSATKQADLVGTPTERLARELAALQPSWRVETVLWWKKPIRSARTGGSRSAIYLHSRLAVAPTAHAGAEFVLIDDVCSSGGHLVAAEAALRDHGITVAFALCAGRTVWEEEEEPFALQTREFETL